MLHQFGLGCNKHDKRRMRAQEQCSVRSVVLDADDLG